MILVEINLNYRKLMNRRKPHELQLKRNEYIAHIRKLEELTSPNNATSRSLARERRKIASLLRNSHKIHHEALEWELKSRQQLEYQTHRVNFQKIKSVIKAELDRPILTVPMRHKPNLQSLQNQNIQFVNKILKIKSQFNFREEAKKVKNAATNRQEYSTKVDYSKIYQESKINKECKKRIEIGLGRKNANKYLLNFIDVGSMIVPKQSQSVYLVSVNCQSKHKKSHTFPLLDILASEIVLEVPQKYSEKDIVVGLSEVVGQKDILRYKILIKVSQLCKKHDKSQQKENASQQNEILWISKPILDSKDKAIGLIQIQMKPKCKKSTHATTHKNSMLIESEHLKSDE